MSAHVALPIGIANSNQTRNLKLTLRTCQQDWDHVGSRHRDFIHHKLLLLRPIRDTRSSHNIISTNTSCHRHPSNTITMMSSFSLSPSVAISPFYNMGRSNRPKGRIRNSTSNFAYFAIAVFSLALALAYQNGEIQTNYARKSSPFIGTAPVSASVATTSLSLRSSRVSSPTSVSMTAGSSRTLIGADKSREQ